MFQLLSRSSFSDPKTVSIKESKRELYGLIKGFSQKKSSYLRLNRNTGAPKY